MGTEHWMRVEQLCQEALEHDESQQEAFLDAACKRDPELRREVESLLAHRQRANTFLEAPAVQLAANALCEIQSAGDASRTIGRLVSHYRILEKIASGGMGDVYLGERADGTYDKKVAIKIIPGARSSDYFLERFRNERQILAGLEHPNIARLIDGGTTEEGLPYLVMEFVEGQRIDEFCSQKNLDIGGRLELFRTVCSAVHYAHQNLVVHRDLKPSNILVTAAGIPKLLDFGIAKILDTQRGGADSQQTIAFLCMFTPDYASPEQIRNQPISTSSDVYSLGVILYELLTGARPYRVNTNSREEMIKAVCDTEPEKPSTVATKGFSQATEVQRSAPSPAASSQPSKEKGASLQKALAGDLDNIVLKALRKEPQRRYLSVEQFSEDIRRYLAGLPVLAHEDTVGYRARKFVSRHRLGVAAAALLILSLAGGLIATLRQAHIAKIERARAERRFNDVRKLANTLIFEIHDSIRDLPGATKARELLVRRALEYLDSLSQESGDPALQREIAAAYDRIGDVRGYTGAANLDDFDGASKSYTKALAIRESLAAAKPDDPSLRSELVHEYFNVANALQNTGDFEGELRMIEKARPLVGGLSSANYDRQFRTTRMYYYTGRALERMGDYPGALANYEQAAATLQPVADTGNATARSYVAEHYNGIAKVLANMGRTDEAVASAAKARDILQKLLAEHPQNATFLGYLGESYDATTDVLMAKGDLAAAMQSSLQTLAVYKQLLSSDPGNQMARADIGWSEVSIAEILLRENKPQEAISHARDAVENFHESGPSKGYWTSVELGQSYLDLGKAYAALAEHAGSAQEKARMWREAKSWNEEALKARTASPGQRDDDGVDQVAEIRRQLARCEAHTGGG